MDPNSHSLSPVPGSMLVFRARGTLKRTTGTLGSVSTLSWKVAFRAGSSKQGNASLVYTACKRTMETVRQNAASPFLREQAASLSNHSMPPSIMYTNVVIACSLLGGSLHVHAW